MKAVLVGAVVSMMGGAAFANPPLKDVVEIKEGLITAGMAMEIDKQCDDISVRLIRGVSFLRDLKGRAAELGYSADEIDAYVDDKEEKAHLEAIARERLAGLGAVSGQGETYCTVGAAEIAGATPVGLLLK